MKRNMSAAMDALEIDNGIRGLIKKLWLHGYETFYSCEGMIVRPDPVAIDLLNSNRVSVSNYGLVDSLYMLDLLKNPEEGKDHSIDAYVILHGGDGWFEDNAHRYGLNKLENQACCTNDSFSKFRNCCRDCGAGINGRVVYRGILVPEMGADSSI